MDRQSRKGRQLEGQINIEKKEEGIKEREKD